MSLRLSLSALALLAAPAAAQQFQGMQYDQGLNMALQQMLGAFGSACQMGDPGACSGFDYVQQAANYLMGASDACLMGDPMACQAYQMAWQDMSMTYAGFQQAMGGGMMGGDMAGGMAGDMTSGMTGVNPLGETQADRLGAIAQFGADNAAAFDQRMQAMDDSQQQFLSTLGD